MPLRDKNYLETLGWGVIEWGGDHFEIISPSDFTFSGTAMLGLFPTRDAAWQQIFKITLQPKDWDIFDKHVQSIGSIVIMTLPEDKYD